MEDMIKLAFNKSVKSAIRNSLLTTIILKMNEKNEVNVGQDADDDRTNTSPSLQMHDNCRHCKHSLQY